MRTLDRDRPYGAVYGSDTGARFVQDNIDFDGAGNALGAPSGAACAGNPAVISPAAVSPISVAAPAVAAQAGSLASVDFAAPTPPIEDQHWREIKAAVEAYGGTWTNKKDGLAFLRGQA